MKARLINFVFPLLLLLVVFCVQAQNPPSKSQPKQKPKPLPLTSQVILVSIDGLKIEDLKNPRLKIPTLKRLLDRGTVALNLESIYPSKTLPAHATILTGMFPSDHGVISDFKFDEKAGTSTSEKFGLASEIKTDTLSQAAKRNGLKTAAINFPFSDGAEVDFKSPSLQQISEIIKEQRIQLVLVKFDELANSLQRNGLGSLESITALENIDSALQKILAIFEQQGTANDTSILIVSSHGYAKVEQEFFPNQILAKKGFLTLDAKGNIKDWIVAVHSSGGAAAIYLKDPQNEGSVETLESIFEEFHEKEGSPIWRMIYKKDALKLGADPRAVFFIEASPGFIFSEKTSGKKISDKLNSSANRVDSGYLPSRSEMRGFFLATGKGIKTKSQIEYVRLVDIAPTIARLLGFELKASRGHAISEIFTQQNQK